MKIWKELNKSIEQIEKILVTKKLVTWDYLEQLELATPTFEDYERIVRNAYRNYLYSEVNHD